MKFPRSAIGALIAACALAVPALAQADFPQVRISNFGADGDLNQRASLADPVYNSQTNQFLVVYEAGAKAADHYWDVWGQRLDATGARVGDPFQISFTRPGPGMGDEICLQDPPAVAYSPLLNQFLVSWNQGDGANCDDKIMARAISADGTPLGTPKQISDTGYTDTETTEPLWNSVQNEWMVGWKADIPTTSKQDLFAQRLGGDLTEVGPNDARITHLSDTAGDGVDDAMGVAFDPVNNRYLFVAHGNVAAVTGVTEVWGHLTDGNLAPIGDDHFRISHVADTNTNGYAYPPRVVYDGAGKRYLVVWSADPMLPGQVDDETDQFGRYVAVDGALQGTTDMRLSDMGPDGDTSYYVARPDLGFNPNAGELFAVWHGNDNTGTLVTDEREIFGQRLGASGAEVGDNDFRISHWGPDGDVNYAANRPALALNTSTCQFLVTWNSGRINGVGGLNEEWDIYGNLVDAPCPPLNQALPAISGTADEGQTLSCSDGTWSGRGLAFSREWLRDGTPIAGATANSYLLTAADATHQVACRVTATDPDGTASATSAAVTPTAKPVPVVVPPKDTTPPASTIVVPKQKLANVLKKGLKFTLSCNEPCTLTAVLKASYSAPKRSGKAAKTLTIATKRVTITKAGKVTVTFKFNKKAKKALAKIKKVKFTLTVTAKDGAGNTKRYTKSATLKRK